MTSSKHREESPTVGQDTAEDMVKYGITRVPTDYFSYKKYRYTSLDDAIAQAKRQHSAADRFTIAPALTATGLVVTRRRHPACPHA